MPILKRAPKTVLGRREEARMSKAVADILGRDELNKNLPVGKKVTFRSVSAKYKISIGTLHSRVELARNPPPGPAARRGPPIFFTAHEENIMVELVALRADRGHPQYKSDLQDMAAMVVERSSEERKRACPFKNGRPGEGWVKAFMNRHPKIRLGRASRNQEVRFRHCNGDALTTHLASIHHLIESNGIPPSNIANLDEAGCTPGKDVKGLTTRKVITRRGVMAESREPEFDSSCTRVTIMPVTFADGTCGSPLFVFKGEAGVRCRTVERGDGKQEEELIMNRLPVGSIVSYNRKVAGVDGHIFYKWAERFVEETKPRRANGYPLLLVYDGYRSHLTHRVLSLFEGNNIIAYALPSHTSGVTQPLDVAVFSPFKDALNMLIMSVSRRENIHAFDIFDFCTMMREAYYQAFTHSNTTAGFKAAGIWPTSARPVLCRPLPKDSDNVNVLLTVEELDAMFSHKVAQKAAGLDLQPKVLKRGFINTDLGNNLTCPEALALAKKADDDFKRKKVESEAARLEKERVRKEKQGKKERDEVRKLNARYEKVARAAGMSVNEMHAKKKHLKAKCLRARLRAEERRGAQGLLAAEAMVSMSVETDRAE